MKIVRNWWNTSCEVCLRMRRFCNELAQLGLSILSVLMLLSAGLFIYWLFFDTEPSIHYGSNYRVEFVGDRIILYLDAKRVRDCPTKIKRKISGCGQIDLPETIATTPIGEYAGPASYPLSVLFQSFTREQLSGNTCTIVSQAEATCNPAQALLKMPIIFQSPPITFVPVPRAKTYDAPGNP